MASKQVLLRACPLPCPAAWPLSRTHICALCWANQEHTWRAQRKVQVVVLCGGFGQTILNDLQRQIEAITDTHQKNVYRNLIKRGPGGLFVTEALLPVHRASAVYHMLCSMQTAQRLLPLEDNVFFVHNEANRGKDVAAHPCATLCWLSPARQRGKPCYHVCPSALYLQINSSAATTRGRGSLRRPGPGERSS